MDISKYIQDIDSEILGQKEDLIKKMIDSQLRNFQFDEKNISPNLISILMMKPDIKIPIPEKKDIPSDIKGEASGIADIINTNVAGIYTDLMVGNNVYLYGKAGTGKTTLAKKIANDLIKRQPYTINCNQFTSPINLVGGQTIEGYKQGEMVKAWQSGGLLILDELPKLDPNTAGILNEALAQSADQPSVIVIGETEYKKRLEMIKESDGKELGFRIYDSIDELLKGTPERAEEISLLGKKLGAGKHYFKKNLIYITDGKGDKIIKDKNFCVIATGNTNMKEISANFSGNNRQDYSLVDRFAGSFYEILYDDKLEQSLTYDIVYKVSVIIRKKLDIDDSSIESISLRTMLNFNRIFEQEYLRKIKSPYAIDAIKIGDRSMAKTFSESLQSFVSTLAPAKQTEISKTDAESLAASGYADYDEFIQEFIRIHGIDPKAGEGK
jgi:tRNA A37 threonylcarbamoyladenosine biosynthesis protein TsaE